MVQNTSECFCADLDYVKLCQLYNSVSHQKDQSDQENLQLKTKLDAANNVISHLTKEIKSVFASHQAYKDKVQQDMDGLRKNNLNYINSLKLGEQKILSQHKDILQLTRSVKEVTFNLDDQKNMNAKLNKKLENFVYVSKQVQSTSPINSARKISSSDCKSPRSKIFPGNQLFLTKEKSSENNSVNAVTAYTTNASKTVDSYCKNDFLSSGSSSENQNQDTPSPKKDLGNTFDNHVDDDSDLSIIYENETSVKVHNLESIFKQSKLRDRILKFLHPSDMIALRSTNKFFNFAMSIDSRVFKGILQHQNTQFEIKIESLEKKLSLFEGNTANISGDYVQFLLYKYVKLKKSPGHYIQDAFSEGSQLHQLIKDPLASKALQNKSTEDKTPLATREKSGFMDNWFKKSPIVEKIQTGKFMDKLKSINNAIKSGIKDNIDSKKENQKPGNGQIKINADDTSNCSVAFIEEPAVREEISRLEERSKEQDFESIGIKLETDINSIPKELIVERNNFFDKTMEQIKTGSATFNKLVKDLDTETLRELSTKIFGNWIQTFFLSQLLFQEAKELSTLKEFLACELAKTCFENCGLTSEVENLKEQFGVTQRVKEYLLAKSTNLELKIHETTCDNASINEQRRIMEIQAKS